MLNHLHQEGQVNNLMKIKKFAWPIIFLFACHSAYDILFAYIGWSVNMNIFWFGSLWLVSAVIFLMLYEASKEYKWSGAFLIWAINPFSQFLLNVYCIGMDKEQYDTMIDSWPALAIKYLPLFPGLIYFLYYHNGTSNN